MNTAVTDRKPRLLLVDDNPGDVELFRHALRHAHLDCELEVIYDGGEALDLVRREASSGPERTPDLVVLDLNLPKADGREILTEMRGTAAFARVPVMILTSSNSPREREQLEVLGISRHVSKPPDLHEFLKLGLIVKEVLDSREDRARRT